MDETRVKVGKYEVPLNEARSLIETYTTPAQRPEKRNDFYSWPYYDHLDTGPATQTLTDGDLLAPVLLNVNPRLYGFAELQRIRGDLESKLADLPQHVDHLQAPEASPDTLDRVAALFGVLDADRRVLGVRATVLSKVLHRKRPGLIPLYDTFVRNAYVPDRVKPVKGRSWANYMRALLAEMQADLQASPDAWKKLTEIPSEGGLTQLRALDIIAWSKGKKLRDDQRASSQVEVPLRQGT